MKREAVLESRKVMNQKGAAVMKVKTDRESRKEWSLSLIHIYTPFPP